MNTSLLTNLPGMDLPGVTSSGVDSPGKSTAPMGRVRAYSEPALLTDPPSRTNRARQWVGRFLIRLRHWEYWPFAVVYAPIIAYYLYLSAKARSLFFFSAANPSIESGGMLGESKIDILDRISDQYKPKTLFFRQSASTDEVLNRMVMGGIWFPIIAKPDRGERGWRVEKVDSETELTAYLLANKLDLIVQEYVDEPIELGIFYYRMPGERTGTISSIVQKELLSVEGDGQSTILDLINKNDRARLQLPALTKRYGYQLTDVLEPDETRQLMPIGNHCRGTKFMNANHLITPELTDVFDQISLPVDGFYYGRYDIRCRSIAELYRGQHIRILELNGVGAEPAHIYQPGFSLWEGWRVLLRHWHILYTISHANQRRGIAYMTFQEARTIYHRIQSHQNQ